MTVYAFSTENYSRPPSELKALHGVFLSFCSKILSRCKEWDLRVKVFSTDSLSRMPVEVAQALKSVVEGEIRPMDEKTTLLGTCAILSPIASVFKFSAVSALTLF